MPRTKVLLIHNHYGTGGGAETHFQNLVSALRGREYDTYTFALSANVESLVPERDYLRQNPLPNEAFVYERIGEEGHQLVKALRQQDSHGRRSFPAFLHRLRRGLRSLPAVAKRRIPHWLLRAGDRRALEIGRFRLAGEVHQWMYDRYSLALLLIAAGFRDPQLQDASTSRIPNWTSFHLDTLSDGQVIKPDLFFMEAIKP